MQQVLQIELNEVNFEYVDFYSKAGALPNFRRILNQHGLVKTTSEEKYEDLEPWIQWVSAHTGLSFEDHGVFRLGDIESTNHEQIWERLEADLGLVVGAISPMNAKNRTAEAAFFVPDPWTTTKITASLPVRRVYGAIRQVVSDNANSKIKLNSLLWLCLGLVLLVRPHNIRAYWSLASRMSGRPWIKAMILDQILADLFVKLVNDSKPQFATLFLNAGAHIQHHYMFSSAAYDGDQSNPAWYLGDGEDPLLDIYKMYDGLLGRLLDQFGDSRLIVATGLHQDPYPVLTYYWRLKDHEVFLRKVGIPFVSVEPRMSRDFLITCRNADEARDAAAMLSSARSMENQSPLFTVDNRGLDLFVILSYAGEIDDDFEFELGSRKNLSFREDVAFVAIKNGEHNGIGYLVDTGFEKESRPEAMELTDLFNHVINIFAAERVGDRDVDTA
jgi:hypothetical protein